jgi:polyphenol oxidase
MTDVSLQHFSFSTHRHTACVSTRIGGVSGSPFDSLNVSYSVGDDATAVAENRRRVLAGIGQPIDALTMLRQVHSANVMVVDDTHRGRGAHSEADVVADGDALITATPGVVIAVLVADCVPVVMVDPVRDVVAVAHAGWRGTVAHVTARTVEQMVGLFGCDPVDLVAGIGPSIGATSYEVGPEVVARARAEFDDRPDVVIERDGRFAFDLWLANAHDLQRSGLRADAIECSAIDTRTSTDRFFSHRAGHPTGRFMALAALRT